MTVYELINALSALENMEGEIRLRGNNWFVVPIEEISESSADGLTCYILSEKCPDSEDEVIAQAAKGLAEYCDKHDKAHLEIETKAVKLAEKIIKNTLTLEKSVIIDNIDWSDLRAFLCLMSICRKAVMDSFSLEDYEILEIPSVEDEYTIMYLVNKFEYGMGENYNPHAHEIIFQCFFGNPIAVPLRLCNDDGTGEDHKVCENCFDAVYECGNY